MRNLAALALFLAAAPLRADTLAEVKSALAKLEGKQPLRATYEIKHSNSAKGRFYNQDFAETAAIEVRIDHEGLNLTYPRALIDKAENDRDDVKQGTTHVARIAPLDVAEMLDFAPTLLDLIGKGTLVEEKQAMYAGQPARLLVLKIAEPPRPGEKDMKVKMTKNQLSLWVGADRVPLAAEHVYSFSAGILFFHGDGTTKNAWTFARHEDHLVAVRRQSDSSGSGLGQNSKGTSLETVTLK